MQNLTNDYKAIHESRDTMTKRAALRAKEAAEAAAFDRKCYHTCIATMVIGALAMSAAIGVF